MSSTPSPARTGEEPSTRTERCAADENETTHEDVGGAASGNSPQPEPKESPQTGAVTGELTTVETRRGEIPISKDHKIRIKQAPKIRRYHTTLCRNVVNADPEKRQRLTDAEYEYHRDHIKECRLCKDRRLPDDVFSLDNGKSRSMGETEDGKKPLHERLQEDFGVGDGPCIAPTIHDDQDADPDPDTEAVAEGATVAPDGDDRASGGSDIDSETESPPWLSEE